jgi:hypothetical protein
MKVLEEHAMGVFFCYAPFDFPFLLFEVRESQLSKVYSLYLFIESLTNGRMTSPLRSSTPQFNGNGNTRPTSPASSSPLRHTVAITSSNANYANNNIRSRDASREREKEPLDYTDLEGSY